MASLDVVMEGQLAAHLALPESGWPVLRYRDSYMQASLATPLSTLFVPERVEHSGDAARLPESPAPSPRAQASTELIPL